MINAEAQRRREFIQKGEKGRENRARKVARMAIEDFSMVQTKECKDEQKDDNDLLEGAEILVG